MTRYSILLLLVSSAVGCNSARPPREHNDKKGAGESSNRRIIEFSPSIDWQSQVPHRKGGTAPPEAATGGMFDSKWQRKAALIAEMRTATTLQREEMPHTEDLLKLVERAEQQLLRTAHEVESDTFLKLLWQFQRIEAELEDRRLRERRQLSVLSRAYRKILTQPLDDNPPAQTR